MPVQPTKTYFLSINNNDINRTLRSLLGERLQFEILDPYEVDGEWMQVKKLSKLQNADEILPNLNTLTEVIKYYETSGMFSSLFDNRFVIAAGKIDEVYKQKDTIIKKALQLLELKDLRQTDAELSAKLPLYTKKSKEIILGRDLDQLRQAFEVYIEHLINTFETSHQDTEGEIVRPQIDLIQIGQYQGLVFQEEYRDEIWNFVVEHSDEAKWEAFTPEVMFQKIKDTQLELIRELTHEGINPDNIKESLLVDFGALHANYEREATLNEFRTNLFKTHEDGKSVYAFLTVEEFQVEPFKELIKRHDTSIQEYATPKPIVSWNQNGIAGAFKSIVSSLGTLSLREANPTPWVALFFALFFAMSINDALYGGLLTIITGSLLLNKKLKHNLKATVSLFFWCGVASIVYGALTFSWAGDLIGVYIGGPLADTLSQFQLIESIDSNADVTINNFLRNNGGFSPILFMLGVSVLIGSIHLLTGYVLKIITHIQEREIIEALGEGVWILFLFSLVGLAAQPSPITQYTMFALLIGLFVVNTSKGFSKILSGAGRVYSLISVFSDVLSYTRLVAVGLTGSIIANVINQLADLIMTGGGPVIGLILGLVFLVIGHTFNLVIGLFGAYINPLRLHYVEFFPKFFKGEGRNINPIDFDYSFVSIKS